VPPGETLHPEIVSVLRAFAVSALSPAEVLRLLRPEAARVGVSRPSYPTVRRFLLEERRRRRRQVALTDRVVGDLLAGRVPLA
jgi:hypothetical protein